MREEVHAQTPGASTLPGPDWRAMEVPEQHHAVEGLT